MIGVGTGKGFLVYQLHWIMELVQEKAFWCTNCIESWSWYRKRPSGVPTALNRGVGTGKGRLVYQRLESWSLYRKRPSGVPTALNHGFGTGKGFLVYQPPWIVDLVQEKAIWCTNRLESWSLYRKRLSGVPTPWIVDFGQLRPFWSTKLSDWIIWFTTEFAVTEIVEVTGESVKFLYSGC